MEPSLLKKLTMKLKLFFSHQVRSGASRKHFWLIFLIIVIIAGGLLWFYYEHEAAPTVQVVPPVSVETAGVTQQTIPVSIDALGTLSAIHEVDISPEIDGQVAAIDFQNGQDVKKGHLLFQLDDSVARAQLAAALAKLRLSQEDFKRNSKLLENDALSQQGLDKAREELAENTASVNEQHLLVQKMQLRAPFAGTIGSRKVSVGQYVSVGQTLVKLVNTSDLKVIYHVSEVYLSQLKLGQTVEITTSALPGELFTGTVNYISPNIDVTTRTVEVHASVPNNADQLAPGMFVKVSQELSERPNALVIPAEALVATISGSEVFVAQNGHAVQTHVKIGARWQDKVEVLSGLNKNARVIIAGQQNLRDGSAISVLNNSKDKA